MNKFSSMFGQALQIFSKKGFFAMKMTKSEKGANGSTSWGQFVTMLFCPPSPMPMRRDHGDSMKQSSISYKDRWQSYIFFKTIKQNLKMKIFVGTSANILTIQLWTAVMCVSWIKLETDQGKEESGDTTAYVNNHCHPVICR